MICPNCQKDLPDDVSICDGCHYNFETVTTEDTQTLVNNGMHSKMKVSGQNKDVKITKISKSEKSAGGTKVNRDISAPPTMITPSKTYPATKIAEDPNKPKPIFGWIVVIEGNQQWEQFTIPDENCRFIIGSGNDADIQFDDEGIEKSHISLRLNDGRLYITDLDTALGTMIYDKRITRVELEDGAQFSMGSVSLKYRKF